MEQVYALEIAARLTWLTTGRNLSRLNYENILNKDVEAYKSDNNIAKTLADANNRFIKKWENIIIFSKETIESNEKKLEIAKKELSKYQ